MVLAFPQFLFVIALQVRIVPARDEGGIEKHMAQIAIAALGNIPLTQYGGATLIDAAVDPNVGDQFLRCGKTINVADKCHQGSCASTPNSGNRPEELLRLRLISPHRALDTFN